MVQRNIHSLSFSSQSLD